MIISYFFLPLPRPRGGDVIGRVWVVGSRKELRLVLARCGGRWSNAPPHPEARALISGTGESILLRGLRAFAVVMQGWILRRADCPGQSEADPTES